MFSKCKTHARNPQKTKVFLLMMPHCKVSINLFCCRTQRRALKATTSPQRPPRRVFLSVGFLTCAPIGAAPSSTSMGVLKFAIQHVFTYF